MAVDSQVRRASVLGIVQPDGTIAQTDRQTLLWVYGGIAAGDASTVTMVKITAATASEHITHNVTVGGYVSHTLTADDYITHSIAVEDSV